MAEKDFQADSIIISMVAVNRQSINIYRKYIIEIAAIDINNVTKTSNISFIVTDIKYYKAILNYLQLYYMNFNCRF